MRYWTTKYEIFALFFGWLSLSINGLDPYLISPCPEAFSYRFQDLRQNIWYGTLLISSDNDLYTLQSIRILLDQAAESLQLYDHKTPNTIVDTIDNTEFLIEGLDQKIRKGNTISVTISVKYRSESTIPKLTVFRVNEQTICSSGALVGTNKPNTVAATTLRPAGANEVYHGGNTQSPWTSRPVWDTPSLPPKVGFEEQCGTRVPDVTPLVINGIPSRRGQWPWHGALYKIDIQGPQYRCGSTLISRRHVITAAHCVCVHLHVSKPQDPKKILFVFGRMHLSRWHDTGSQDIQAEEILVHPDYNTTNFHNDIAVVRLAKEIEISPWVRPVCLWPDTDNKDIKMLANKNGTVVGWGFTKQGTVSEVLLHAQIPVIEPFECVSTNYAFYVQYLSPKSYCAGTIGSTSACNGDSGGGMVFQRSRSEVWQLRGVVSIAALDRDSNMCDVNQYVLFTDVAYYLSWIHKYTRS